jgi:hypothetical protein
VTIAQARARERALAAFGLSYAALALVSIRTYRQTGRRRFAAAGVLVVLATLSTWCFAACTLAALLGAYAGRNVRDLIEVGLTTAVVMAGTTLGAELLASPAVTGGIEDE